MSKIDKFLKKTKKKRAQISNISNKKGYHYRSCIIRKILREQYTNKFDNLGKMANSLKNITLKLIQNQMENFNSHIYHKNECYQKHPHKENSKSWCFH